MSDMLERDEHSTQFIWVEHIQDFGDRELSMRLHQFFFSFELSLQILQILQACSGNGFVTGKRLESPVCNSKPSAEGNCAAVLWHVATCFAFCICCRVFDKLKSIEKPWKALIPRSSVNMMLSACGVDSERDVKVSESSWPKSDLHDPQKTPERSPRHSTPKDSLKDA